MPGLAALAFERLIISGLSSPMFGKYFEAKESTKPRQILTHKQIECLLGQHLIFKNVMFWLTWHVCRVTSQISWDGTVETFHCPLWAFKSFFQFWSQRAIFHSKRPNPHLPLCSGAPGCPKLMCELVTFEKNLVAASKKFRFYTIKCSKYQKNLGRKCQF